MHCRNLKSICILCVLLSSTAYAGGPFVIDTVGNTGVAQQWTKNTVTWYSEDGPLSNTITNDVGKSWIDDAFSKWRDAAIKNAKGVSVKTVDLTITYAGSIGKDINKTNYSEYLAPSAGPTVIVFDVDGSILDALGVDKTSVVGISAPLLSDASGTKIVKGFSLFNAIKCAMSANRVAALFSPFSIMKWFSHSASFDSIEY